MLPGRVVRRRPGRLDDRVLPLAAALLTSICMSCRCHQNLYKECRSKGADQRLDDQLHRITPGVHRKKIHRPALNEEKRPEVHHRVGRVDRCTALVFARWCSTVGVIVAYGCS
jgi:hypothetical protein